MNKRLHALLLLLICCIEATLHAQTNTWTQKTSYTAGREGATGFSIGSKGYVGTGKLNTNNQNDFWEYDPSTNVWTQKANFGGSIRCLATGFSIGSKGYLGLGNSSQNDFWEYDPVANTWTQKANFGGTGRASAVGFSIGNKGYIGTGINGTTNLLADFWQYNPATNTWTQKASFPGSARWGAFGFALRNKGYIGSGDNYGSFYPNDFYEYDTAANSWTQKANTPSWGRILSGAFAIGPFGYMGCGTTTIGLATDFWQYDPTANAWTQKATFGGTGRDQIAAFGVGGKGYFATGYAGNYNSQVWEYNPDQLLTGAITGNAFCAGASVTVPFTTNITTYTSSNVFTAQLSNASGSFAAPVSIGTLTSTTSGSISATIPASTTTGTGYRIRVVSSSPVGLGADNGSDLTISAWGSPSISIVANLIVMCAGTTDVFMAAPVNGGTAPAYQWKVNGLNAGTNSNVFGYTPTMGDVVNCDLTSNFACATTPTASSNSISLTVNPIVTPSISISTATTNVCSGIYTSLTATSVNPGSLPTYQWKVNGVNTGTSSNSLSYYPSNNDTVICILTSSAPCATVSTASSNLIVLNVTPSVTPSVSTSVSPGDSICAGTTVTFTASPINGGSSPTYQWKKNGSNVGTSSVTYVNSSLANNDVITFELGNTDACASPATATSNSTVMSVTPYVTPAISVSGNPGTAICAGASIVFTAAATGGGTSPVYQWIYNGVNVGSNSPSYTPATVNDNDTVMCAITNNAKCVTSKTGNSAKLKITVYPLPNPVISQTGGLLNSGIATGTFQWYVDGSSIPGAASTDYLPGKNGSYTVSVIDSNGCTKQSDPFLISGLGVSNGLVGQEHIGLYPNPANDMIYLNTRVPLNIRIMSLDGKLLITKKNAVDVNVRNLKPGMYILEMESVNKEIYQSTRFIK